MLVYYYLPKGYANLGMKRIHGSQLGFPPTRVDWKEYFDNKDILVMCPFTPTYIEKAVGKSGFPYKAYFTLDMIKSIPYRDLQKIATFLDVPALLDNTKLIYSVRNAVKDL